MSWISINTRKPTTGVKVLVKNNGLINVACLEKEGWLLEVKTITDCADNTLIYLYNVTHWALLQMPIERQEEDEKSIEVTYTFYLPDHQDDLNDFENGKEYSLALWEIYHDCRQVWKYEENPSDDKVEFAEHIADKIAETGALD